MKIRFCPQREILFRSTVQICTHICIETVNETAEEVSSSCVFLIYTGYTQIGRCSALVVDMLPKNPDSLEMHHYTGIFQCSDAFFFLCTVQ